MSKRASKRSGPRAQPLVVGPDLHGFRAVVAGDRLCWFGQGQPPQTPGARRVLVPQARIVPGEFAQVKLRVSDRTEQAGKEFDHHILGLQALGVTTLVVRLTLAPHPGAARDALRLEDAAHQALIGLRRLGFRLLVGTAPEEGELVSATIAGLARNNRDRNSRFAIFIAPPFHRSAWEADPVTGVSQVGAEDIAGPVAASYCFGRRFGSLEEGAVGDLAFRLKDGGFLPTRIVAGCVFGS